MVYRGINVKSKQIPDATADYTDATNLEAASLIKNIEELFVNAPHKDLCKFVSEVENKIFPNLSGPYRDRVYLAALSLLVFHEKI